MAARHRIRGSKGQFVPGSANRPRSSAARGTFVDTLTPGIGLYAVEVRHLVNQEAREWAKDTLAHMKANAPWADRTGMARSGLNFAVDEGADEVSVTFYYSVTYGVWLEIAMAGEYAIIMPTIEALGPDLMRRLGGL